MHSGKLTPTLQFCHRCATQIVDELWVTIGRMRPKQEESRGPTLGAAIRRCQKAITVPTQFKELAIARA
jgi:hypothetical protein